jgi:geranylgeranyl diphosphate synthase type II
MPIPPGAEVEHFSAYVDRRRAEIDAALDRVLPRPPVCPSRVAEAMRYSVYGGKRLRPILALAAAEAVVRAQGEASDSAVTEAQQLAMPAACAIEMIHSFSLVHDDLPAMDNDRLRRGRPATHLAYGEGLAILAGDGLLAEAFALLANEPPDSGDPHSASAKLLVIRRVGRAVGAAGMLGGQGIDLEWIRHLDQPQRARSAFQGELLEDMQARKTGALIRAAAAAGAIIAGGTSAQIEAIDRFAAEVGLAYQIIDDVLDLQGNSADLGKTTGKDTAAGKLTYPAVHGLNRSRELAGEVADRAICVLVKAQLADDRLIQIARWTVERHC